MPKEWWSSYKLVQNGSEQVGDGSLQWAAGLVSIWGHVCFYTYISIYIYVLTYTVPDQDAHDQPECSHHELKANHFLFQMKKQESTACCDLCVTRAVCWSVNPPACGTIGSWNCSFYGVSSLILTLRIEDSSPPRKKEICYMLAFNLKQWRKTNNKIKENMWVSKEPASCSQPDYFESFSYQCWETKWKKQNEKKHTPQNLDGGAFCFLKSHFTQTHEGKENSTQKLLPVMASTGLPPFAAMNQSRKYTNWLHPPAGRMNRQRVRRGCFCPVDPACSWCWNRLQWDGALGRSAPLIIN